MQKEPLLLSSAKIGIMQEKSRLSWGRIFLGIVCAFFVLYGAVDIARRAFSSEFSDAASRDETQAEYPVSSSTTAVEVPKQVIVPLTPSQVLIPSLSITASVEQAGKNAAGNMAAPKHFDTVAWYKLGSRPGEPGNAIIAGHLNNSLGLSGVFEKLSTIELGSEITVEGESRSIRYVVREVHIYNVTDAPAAAIFSTTGPSRLILITCDGAWDSGVRSYDKRLVVVADPL